MSRFRFIKHKPGDAGGSKSQIPLLPPGGIDSPKVWCTAHTVSAVVSILLHTTIVCNLAAIVIAGDSMETAASLDAIFTLEEADVGSRIMRQIALKNGGEYRFIPDGF